MTLRFFVAEALRSIRANAAVSVAATVTVLIAVFILGAFIPSFLYVQSTVDSQKSRLDIDIYLADSATVQQVNGIKTQLTALQQSDDVASFKYVSPEEGLKDLRGRLNDPSILDELPSNPLPAKFNVKPTDPSRSGKIIASFKDTSGNTGPGIDPSLGISYGEKTADKLLTVARFIQWAGLALISILLVASILLIGNTIRLSIFARRREVEVMKLVGATNWFIRWPFVIEGIVCGLIGAALAVALLWAVKITVVDTWIKGADNALTRDQATALAFPLLGLILIASGAIVGALGSGITLRRFLKV
jgi:cell division transport system permease protein